MEFTALPLKSGVAEAKEITSAVVLAILVSLVLLVDMHLRQLKFNLVGSILSVLAAAVGMLVGMLTKSVLVSVEVANLS